jgi:hypothetical protein
MMVPWGTVLSWSLAALCGMAAWFCWLQALPRVPVGLRVIVAFGVFVLGPGATAARLFTRRADRLERAIVPLGSGLVTAATVAYLLGMLGALRLFPWVAAALTGLAVHGAITGTPATNRPDRRAILACVLVAALAGGAGAVAYAKRLTITTESVIVNGDYDSYDSSYYAAMSSELATHVPPEAPFYAGHRLNFSYHPQLVLGMIYRFGAVPLIDLYFRYAWPVFLIMGALTMFMFVRRITMDAVALLAVCLLLLGSDLSYIAALFFRQRPYWDNLLWSTNWMTPGAEMLYFNPWTLALCVLFLGLWALVHAEDIDERRGLLASCVCFGSLVQFKPFAFASVMVALLGVMVSGGVDRTTKRRLAMVGVGSLAVGFPYLISVAAHYQDSQSVLALGNGYVDVLPDIVMRQLGLGTVLAPMARALGVEWGTWPATLLPLVAANVLFFVGGVGIRLVGVPAVWRAIRAGRDGQPVWPVMAWMIVTGVASPLLLISHPYHQTFQFLHLSLYLLWIFVALTVFDRTRGQPWRRAVVIAAVILSTTPSTLHYLLVKWSDDRHPFVSVDADALTVVDYLRREDPDHTVLIQHYPDRPFFISLLAERRTVLAWARYARDSAPLRAEIDAFFDSARGDPTGARSILTRHHVTHVLETVGSDHIHPDLLRSLRPLVITPAFRLYAVPPGFTNLAKKGSS